MPAASRKQHQSNQTMAHLTQEEKAFMNGLFNDYELSMDDIFRHQHFTIIKLKALRRSWPSLASPWSTLWKAVMPSTLL